VGSAADVVAGYPGGQAVLAAAQKVEHANTGFITEAAERLTKAGTSMGTNGKGVGDAVKALDDAWQGESADQFVSYMARFSSAGTAAGESMAKAGGALGKVVTAIDEAKHFVSTRCEQVISEVKRRIQQNPDMTDEQYDAAVRPITAAAATDIENKLKETDSVLQAAATEIKGAASLSTRYTDIPDPGTQPYVPGPGKAADWDRTPLQKADTSTGIQSTSGSGQQASHAAATSSGGGGGHSGGGSGSFHGSLGSSGGPPAGPVPGNVQDWIKQALEILRANGINVSEADVPKIWAIIQHESGGNPHAINNWDSNAAKGTPSKGLMQCIDPTFNSHKLPGHNDIWNPVDNICAGVNYAISRYGSLDNVPGIKAMNTGGSYRGY
jgi:uncharacterized protein YukE